PPLFPYTTLFRSGLAGSKERLQVVEPEILTRRIGQQRGGIQMSCGFHLPAVRGDAGECVIGVGMVGIELEYGAIELLRLIHVAGLQQSPGAGQRIPDGGGNFLGGGGGAHADGRRDYASSIIPSGARPPGNEKARVMRAFSFVLKEELLLLLASNSGLETGTGGELRHGGCRDLDRFAGLRVLAGACSTLRRLEGTETN